MSIRKWAAWAVAASIAASGVSVAAATTADAAVPVNYLVQYQAQVQDFGWQNPVNDGSLAGTAGQSKRLEALRVGLDGAAFPNGHVCYTGYLANNTASSACDNGTAGTVGQSLPMQGVTIALSGMPGWSVCYQPHVSDIGWEGWSCNGAYAGGDRASNPWLYHLEGLNISLLYNGHGVSTAASNMYTGQEFKTVTAFHVRTTAQLVVATDTVTGQIVDAWIAATTHTWSLNWIAGFHADSRVELGPSYFATPWVTTGVNPSQGVYSPWSAQVPTSVATADWASGNPTLTTSSTFK